jgi:U3 small nucleolar RNA-associated protein 24
VTRARAALKKTAAMTKAKKARKFAEVKRLLAPTDTRLGSKARSKEANAPVIAQETDAMKLAKNPPPASMFFQYNPALGPPFKVLIDTNFVNFSVSNKLDIGKAMLDCLAARVEICVTDCVIAELQKLPKKYALALKVARNRDFKRLACTHKGTYADDCLVNRVAAHRIYIVATCDRDLKRRLRKIPGCPLLYISGRKYVIERIGADGDMNHTRKR